ncbi:MAG: hypothetical protein HQ519_00170 [Planctomycetes bacterium]|nr:hypothetical protein [Planctomycetota bacterium]
MTDSIQETNNAPSKKPVPMDPRLLEPASESTKEYGRCVQIKDGRLIWSDQVVLVARPSDLPDGNYSATRLRHANRWMEEEEPPVPPLPKLEAVLGQASKGTALFTLSVETLCTFLRHIKDANANHVKFFMDPTNDHSPIGFSGVGQRLHGASEVVYGAMMPLVLPEDLGPEPVAHLHEMTATDEPKEVQP